MQVNLVYFKDSGKFYSERSYESKKTQVWQVFEEVQQMYNEKRLPGLVEGAQFITLIDYIDHKDSHPHLILGEQEIKAYKRI
jgi:hypothetical protein